VSYHELVTRPVIFCQYAAGVWGKVEKKQEKNSIKIVEVNFRSTIFFIKS
jgi:hypothetical protein